MIVFAIGFVEPSHPARVNRPAVDEKGFRPASDIPERSPFSSGSPQVIASRNEWGRPPSCSISLRASDAVIDTRRGWSIGYWTA